MSLYDIRGTSEGIVTPLVGRDYFANMVNIIFRSKRSIYFTVFQSSRNAANARTKTGRLVSSILKAKERGVRVRAIVNFPSKNYMTHAANNTIIKLFQEHNVPFVLGRADDTIHSKFFIIDGSIVVVGSHNITDRGLWDNYESSLAVECIKAADYFASYFDFLYSRGRKVSDVN